MIINLVALAVGTVSVAFKLQASRSSTTTPSKASQPRMFTGASAARAVLSGSAFWKQ